MEEIEIALQPNERDNKWKCEGTYGDNRWYSKIYTAKFFTRFILRKGDKIFCSRFDGDFDEYELVFRTHKNIHMPVREWHEVFEIDDYYYVNQIELRLRLHDIKKLFKCKKYQDDAWLTITIERLQELN